MSRSSGESRGNKLAGAFFATSILSICAASPALAQQDATTPTLRFCSDPTNLPFSSDDAKTPGFYNEIGLAIGAALKRPVTFHWYKSYFGQRTVRETMLAKKCDAMIGLPLTKDFMGPVVIFSEAIGEVNYALASKKDKNISSLADLKGLKVAVQYESTPQNLLASHDEVTMHTVLSPDEGMKSLADGQVDVAFVWAPVAAWLNKTDYKDQFVVRQVTGPGLSGKIAIGFAKWSGPLRDQVNAVLPGLHDTILQLQAKYGLSNAQPLQFGALTPQVAPLVQQAAAAAPAPVAMLAVAKVGASADTTAATPAMIEAGHTAFNGTCAHCHGPDAVQSDWHINLKLLDHRYGNERHAVFWKTVHEGRPSKGMPSWDGVFTDAEFNNIFAYLETVQKKAP